MFKTFCFGIIQAYNYLSVITDTEIALSKFDLLLLYYLKVPTVFTFILIYEGYNLMLRNYIHVSIIK